MTAHMSARKFVKYSGAIALALATSFTFSGVSVSSASPPPPPIPCCNGGGPVWGWDTYGGSGGSGELTPSSISGLITQLKGTPGVIAVFLDHGSGPILTSEVVSAIHGHGILIDLIEDSYTSAENTSDGLITS